MGRDSRRIIRSWRALAWLPVGVALAVGVSTLVAMEIEVRAVRDAARRAFENEVAAVTRVVREGTGQAGLAVDLSYRYAELDLACESGDKPGAAGGSTQGDGRSALGKLVVSVAGTDAAHLEGDWGGIPEAEREAFARFVLTVPEGEIVDGGLALARGLYCTHLSENGRVAIRCKDAKRLGRLRRNAGLGRLFERIRHADVVHVGLQDDMSVLAATPGAQLSSFAEDPFLASALELPDETTSFRRALAAGREIVEGATPIELPDGSRALLRVGVDAQGLRLVERSLDERRIVYGLAIGFLVIAALGVALVLLRMQRQAQRHEETMRAKAEEQRHWQTIGQMAGTVAHEVRAPLSTIAMAAQRLRREFSVPEQDREEYEELTGLVASQADRLERVVKDFLALGKPLELRVEPADVREAVSVAVAPLSLAASRRGCRIDVEAPSVEARLDAQRFGQILGNLVSNALDASPDGATVRVRATVEHGMLEVAVADDGPGMDEATVARVQQPFVSTKSHGTGLGLPLARRLAEAHGGSLEISSQPGRGTVARVRLPLGGPERRGRTGEQA